MKVNWWTLLPVSCLQRGGFFIPLCSLSELIMLIFREGSYSFMLHEGDLPSMASSQIPARPMSPYCIHLLLRCYYSRCVYLLCEACLLPSELCDIPVTCVARLISLTALPLVFFEELTLGAWS